MPEIAHTPQPELKHGVLAARNAVAHINGAYHGFFDGDGAYVERMPAHPDEEAALSAVHTAEEDGAICSRIRAFSVKERPDGTTIQYHAHISRLSHPDESTSPSVVGDVEIHRVFPDGQEKTRTSMSPDRAESLVNAIARAYVRQVKSSAQNHPAKVRKKIA